MVCDLCTKNQFKAPDEDCFGHLMSLLKAHYAERVEACKAKDKEIKNLKELNGMVEKTDETENKFSPTLFSENCTFLDDLVESDQDEEEEEDQGDFSLIARGTPPTSTSSPLVPAKTVPVTSNEKLKKIVPVSNNKVVNGRAIAIPTRGWRTKPEQLSFSNINNKTKIHVPQKTTKMKTLTLKESFKRAAPLPAAVSKTNPKRIAVEKVPAVVKMEIPSDDEDEAMFQTPKKKSDDLDDFCDDCRRYYELNPPVFLSDNDRRKKLLACKEHSKKKYRLHLTPEGFWRIDFGPTPPQMKTQLYTKK